MEQHEVAAEPQVTAEALKAAALDAANIQNELAELRVRPLKHVMACPCAWKRSADPSGG